MLKIGRTFVLIITVALWSVFTHASEWASINDFNGKRFEGKLHYHPEYKQIKIYYKNKRNWGDYIPYGPLKVDSPERVSETYAELSDFFKRQLFSEEVAQSLLSSVDELRFLSGEGCQAIFVSGQAPVDSKDSLSDLYEKITLIAESSRLSVPDREAFRSILVDEYHTHEGKIQLRMVLNKDGNFLKFSFTKPSGDMKGFKVNLDQNEIGLRSPASIELLNLNSSRFDGTQGLLIVHSPDTNSALAHKKTFIRLQQEEGNWDIDRYDDETFSQTSIKEGVALSSFTAEHEAIIQIENSDISFPRLMAAQIEDFSFLAKEEELLGDFEPLYNQCMAEKLTYAKAENGNVLEPKTITDVEKSCSLVTGIEVFYRLARKKGVHEQARNCLLKSSLIEEKRGFFEVASPEAPLSLLEDCYEVVNKTRLVQNFVEERIEELPKVVRGASQASDRATYESVLKFIEEDCTQCLEAARQASAHVALRNFIESESFELREDECVKLAKTGASVSRECSRNYYLEARVKSISEQIDTGNEDVISTVRACLEDHIEGEGNTLALIERDEFFKENCFNKAMIPFHLKDIFAEVEEQLSPLIFALPESEKDLIRQKIRELGSSLIGKEGFTVLTPEYKEEIKDEILSSAVRQARQMLYERLREDLNEVDILESQKEKLIEKLSHSFDKANDVFKDSSLIRLSKTEQRTSLNGFSKFIFLEFGQLKTKAQVSQNILYERDAEALSLRIDEDLNKCMDGFLANQAYPFEKKWTECEKKRRANVAQELMRRLMSQRVSEYFDLSSVMANDILSPFSYFDDCIDLKSGDLSVGLQAFDQHLESCKRIVEFDVAVNLSRARLDEYIPLMGNGSKRQESLTQCFGDLLSEVAEPFSGDLKAEESRRSLTEYKEALVSRSPYGNSILSVLKPSLNIEPEYNRIDRENLSLALMGLSEKDLGHEEKWQERLSQCEEENIKDVGSAFREYILENIPSLEIIDHGEQYESLMRDFLDADMIEQLLALKGKLVGMSEDSGVLALKNFIDTLSTLLNDGFIYDKEQTKTELIVFKNELRSFLRWANSNPHGVSLSEASEFFQESELSEHLALAVLSQKTFQSFESGLRQMKQEEIDGLFLSAGCRGIQTYSCLNSNERKAYNRINKKYRNLLEHTKKMTSSYDFRRIMRPDSKEGEEVLSKIRDLYLKPKILGVGVSLQAEEEIMRLVGDAILKDNTAGGFADLFVQEAAQLQLDIEKDKRWAITEYFFFDEKDFDWETLKQTPAGERAIAYYSRYIMLPQFMGQRQSPTIKRLRREQFRRLLTRAQGQNDR